MTPAEALQALLDAAAQISPYETMQTRTYEVRQDERGYYAEEREYKMHKSDVPVLYEFYNGIGDTLVMWSYDYLLDERVAHELAIQIGNKIGWWV